MGELSGKHLGIYEVLEQIGRGGMAAIYRARHPSEDRFVALKVVAPHLSEDPNFEERFRREATMLTKLKHPHIVEVEDVGESDGYAYLVMPFLELGTLTDWLLEGPVSLRHGARLMQQLSDALQFAHDRGIIHRDVKASNVLLDDRGNALLSDFGLARTQEKGASLTGSLLVGTPNYMAPEQVLGEKATARSDQYALGVILYLLTTGRLPFPDEAPMAVALKHVSEPFPKVRKVSPNVPETVERVILKATAKEPTYRFGSVAEMNSVLQGALDHARYPSSYPKPDIDLPESARQTLPLPTSAGRRISPKLLFAAIAGIASLVLLASPVLAAELAALFDFLSPTSSRSSAVVAELEGEQLTAIAGTVQAMSTEMAGSASELMGAEELQTAVAGTLLAPGSLPASMSMVETPAPTLIGLASTATPISTAVATLPTLEPSPSSLPSSVPSTTPLPSPTLMPSSTPPPSDTPIPSPTPDVCSILAHAGIEISGNEVSWEISNGGSPTITIIHIVFDWPEVNEELKKVRLGESTIWNKRDDTPATDIQSNWLGNRVLLGGESKPLKFEFVAPPAATGYDMLVEFDAGCRISADG